MHLETGSVGCLLLGDSMNMRALGEALREQGVDTAEPSGCGDLFISVQEGLRAARRCGGVCIAAEGEWWTAALALAAQLCVDRIVLIAPTEYRMPPDTGFDRQFKSLRCYVRRNLFFCVSEVLVLETEEACAERQMNSVLNSLRNARVYRLKTDDQRWTNCEFSLVEAVVSFLQSGEFMFSLAK
jgi:hypothetical protein